MFTMGPYIPGTMARGVPVLSQNIPLGIMVGLICMPMQEVYICVYAYVCSRGVIAPHETPGGS